MTRYVIDTNIIALRLRNSENVKQHFSHIVQSQDVVIGCPVVWYEVRRGLLQRDAKGQMMRFTLLFSGFEWQDYTLNDWTLASELWAKRSLLGKPVGDADLMIAVFAINRNAILVTDNEKDFVDLGVTIENWK